jgi:predicted nucleic acid-binding protein
MKVMIDTCVVIDALQNRQPFSRDAQKILLLLAVDRFQGCITAKAMTDIFYIFHRFCHDSEAARQTLQKVIQFYDVVDSSARESREGVLSPITDYEDAVLEATAFEEKMDFIVTRNVKDFSQSRVKAILPSDFLPLVDSFSEPQEA